MPALTGFMKSFHFLVYHSELTSELTMKAGQLPVINFYLPQTEERPGKNLKLRTALRSMMFSLLDARTGYAVGENGAILKCISPPDTNIVIPEQFFLYQNYPNPFNSKIPKIAYDLAEVGVWL